MKTTVKQSAAVRLLWPDLAKGFGIFLVALGHSALVASPVKYWIYSFHMPLFFFCSGYFFSLREDSLGKTLRHRAVAILPPYLTYSLCRWGYMVFFGNGFSWKKLVGILVQLPGSELDGYVWFFVGLMGAECVLALVMKLTHSRGGMTLTICTAIALGVWLLNRFAGLPRLPWHLDAGLLLLPYCALGVVLRQHRAQVEVLMPTAARRWVIALGLLEANVGFCALNACSGATHIDYNMMYTNELLSCYLTGVTGLLSFWLFCRGLDELLSRRKKPLSFHPITFVGKNSAVYYCVGWIGSNIAYYALRPFWHPTGLALLGVHLVGLWLVPIPLILLVNRFCPRLAGKGAKSKTFLEGLAETA